MTPTLPTPADPALDMAALLRVIRAARRAGNPADVIGMLDSAVAAHPDRVELRVELGYVQLDLGQPDAAQAQFQAVTAAQPGNVEAMIGLGRVARTRGDLAEALPLFEAAMAADPRHLGARLDVAYARLDRGDLEGAHTAFAAVLADHPRQVGALAGLARIARRRGDRAAALGLTERLLAVEPQHLGQRLDAAGDLVELGRLDAAAEAYQTALALAPEHVDALLGLGRLARQRGRRDVAMDWFRRALAAQPQHLGAQLDIAYGLLDSGERDAAAAQFRRVLDTRPHQPNALIGLARIARQRGERAAARALLTEAVAAEPGHVGARLDLAADLRDWGAYGEARAEIDAVLAADPDQYDALLHLGALQRQAGAQAEALATFERAAARHPAASRPLVEAAQAARALGQPETALALLERARALAPDDPDTLGQLADLAWLAEDFAACLALCDHILAGHPDRAWPAVLGARALSALGRQADALAMLDRAEASGAAAAEVLAGRIEVCKRAGDWPAVRAALAAAGAWVAGDFRLWVEQVQCAIAHGALDAAEAALAQAPAGSLRDLARVDMLHGQIAEAGWRLADARAHYAAAVRQAPDDPGMANDLARICLLLLDLDEAGRLNARSLALETTAAKLRGRSLRPAQSHLGQVLEEFRIDRAAAERLAALVALAPDQRVARLARLVADDPGHTPSAIQLVLALRQSGAFDRTRRVAAGAATLPFRIVQFWNTPTPPDDVQALMDTWRTQNPDWVYDRFDAATARDFLRTHYAPRVLSAFQRASHPASQADLFRLAYLNLHGGLYVDADDRCLAPLETILPLGTALLTWQEGYSTLANNVLGAAPGHPVIRRALADAVAALNRLDADSLWLATGPGLITRSFAAELSQSELTQAEWLRGVAVLTPAAVLRAIAVHCYARYKTTSMHWNRHEFGTRRGAPAAA